MIYKRMLGRMAAVVALTMISPAMAGAESGAQWVPIRTVADQLGATLAWEAATKTAAWMHGGTTLKVQIGSAEAQVDGQKVELPNAVFMQRNRTYVPLNLLEQAAGRDLRWDEQAQRLVVGDLTGFVAQDVANGSHAAYDLKLMMNESHECNVTAKIQVENLSQDKWDQVVMYFIPNAFTEAFKDTDNVLKGRDEDGKPLDGDVTYGTVNITKLMSGGVQVPYLLEYDTLTVPLVQGLRPGEKTEIEVFYRFTLPEPGMRFTKDEANRTYKLAQWYPMLATYGSEGWNKEDFTPRSESYHTGHSDFRLDFDLPEGYSLVSSSEGDPALGTSRGTVTVNNVKELYAQVFKNPQMKMASKFVDGVEVRFFGKTGQEDAMQEGLATAERALRFFRERIGPYPHKQLDVMSNENGMEYPGIVTVPLDMHEMDKDAYKEVIAHEIAHQWFYGVVSSDPYHEGWLDEGLTELATSLYMHRVEGMEEQVAIRGYRYHQSPTASVISNQPLDELENGIFRALYSQPAMKLWEVMKRNAGGEDPVDTGLDFLQTYYETYSYKQVSTEEFVRFAEQYFPVGREAYASWLDLK